MRLTDGTQPAQAFSILVAGADVYVAGFEYKTTLVAPNSYLTCPVAKYWKNGVAVELTSGLQLAEARSIFVSGNDAYVAGFEYGDSGAVAKYWKNGVPVALGTAFAGANSVFVLGGHVYVAVTKSSFGSIAELWTDGVRTALTDGTSLATARQVVVSGNDVYVAGAEERFAKYWKNGMAVALTDGKQSGASANSIAVVTRQD